MKQSVGNHRRHMISPTGHNSKFHRFPKIARRRQSSSGGSDWMSWRRLKLMNKEEEEEKVELDDLPQYHHVDMPHHHSTTNTISPYYRGLTDQSLAIMDHPGISSSCSPLPPPPPHPLQLLSPAPPAYSPYYKGLTDFSLVIHHDSSWSTHSHHHNNSSSSSSSHHLSQSSPYYRGLIDYSLALALPHHPPNSSSSLSSPFRDHNITPPPTPISTHDAHLVHAAFLTSQDMPVLPMETQAAATIEEMPALISGTGTVNQSSSEATLEIDHIQMDLMTAQSDHHDDDDVKWKPLSVNEPEKVPVGITEISVLEDNRNAQKTNSDNDDDVVLVIEDEKKEKPLRERVVSSDLDQACRVDQSTVVLEEENADLEAEDQMELMEIEEEEKEEEEEEEGEELTLRDRGSEEEKKEVDKVVVVLVKQEEQQQNTELEEVEKEELRDHHSKAVAVQQAALEGNAYHYLWATKYQPNTLAEFICNADKALQLKALVKIYL